MRKGRGARAGVACAFAIAAMTGATTQASAQTQDYGGFRNVLAVGQGQTANLPDLVQYEATGEPPASFNNQRAQYTGLVAASPALTAPQLDDFYKPESFGLSAADTVSTATPKGGVRIARDKFNVPHVFGDTRADTEWGAGYASAQDRL